MRFDSSLMEGARRAVGQCMGVKAGETGLIVTDEEQLFLASHFARAAREFEAELFLMEMNTRKMHGEEPPAVVKDAMAAVDFALLITSFSLTHTQARGDATKAGVRIASMPMLTPEIVRGPLIADYDEVKRLSEEICKKLSDASEAVLITDKGTSLVLNISEREGLADTGILDSRGAFGNLPAGEAFIAPLEGHGSGKLVLDGVMAGVGMLDEDIILTIENGRITDISGGSSALALEKILSGADENAYRVAELGIGTNKKASLMGNLLVDEKVYGTVHIGFGDNAHMGGMQKSSSHLDGVVLTPTLMLDGNTLMERGVNLLK